MFGAAVVAWLTIASAPAVESGTTLEAGLYPALVLIHACDAVDRQPSLLADSWLGEIPIRLPVDLEICERTLVPMKIVLGSAGLYRLDYEDKLGTPFAFVTLDPKQHPHTERGFEVVILQLRRADVFVVAESLNRAAEQEERDLPEKEIRTRFVPLVSTSRLVVRYASEARLERYKKLIEELEKEPPEQADDIVLRSWPCRFRRADDLVEDFRDAWKRGGKPALDPVVSMRTNALLFKLRRGDWADVEELLRRIDVLDPEREHK